MKRIFVFVLAATMMIPLAGTCFGATGTQIALQPESGVSFAVAPVVSGTGSGSTLYMMSGAYGEMDRNPNGVPGPGGLASRAFTGVSLWQVRASDGYVELLWANPYTNGGTNQLTGAFSAGVGSLTMVRNQNSSGNSIFMVTNNLYQGATDNFNNSVTGFTLWGFSHGQNPVAWEESVRVEDSGTSTAVLFAPAYSHNPIPNSTESGNSLYFATTHPRWTVNPVGFGAVPLVAAENAANGGATIFCLNTEATGRVNTATANNMLAARNESMVSGFACAPVIKEGVSGVSVYILGAIGAGNGSGVSLFAYTGAQIDTGAAAAWQYRINVTTNANGGDYLLNSGVRNSGENGVTKWPTPCLGKSSLNWGNNNYSGNSLFVTDGVGGVSIFNLDRAVAPTSVGADATFVQYYQYSNDNLPSGVTPIASPVCNGRYLVLPSATGVTVFDSTPDGNGNGTITTPGQPVWGYEFSPNNGPFATTANWYTCGAPVLSDGVVVVPITSDVGAVGEFRANGMILVLRLSDGTLLDSYDLNTGAIASPIVSGNHVWAVDYNSALHKIQTIVEGEGFWGQFKFDAGKTGENSNEDNDETLDDDDSGCFIRTIR